MKPQEVLGGTIIAENVWPWSFMLQGTDCDGKASELFISYAYDKLKLYRLGWSYSVTKFWDHSTFEPNSEDAEQFAFDFGLIKGDSGSMLVTGHLPNQVFFGHAIFIQFREQHSLKENIEVYMPISDFCSKIAFRTGGAVECIDGYKPIPDGCRKKFPKTRKMLNSLSTF
ncbi:hypothetical protein GPALN_010584 [Globodera pallida]|nr:hypothetical protein GPALN_010584 [Globodera pallida]